MSENKSQRNMNRLLIDILGGGANMGACHSNVSC